MKNIYDNINDFYDQEPEWNTIISKNYVEGYIRSLAWSGKTEEELNQIWDDIVIFTVYLANTENFLGDMNRENFIDCIAWITRNIGGRVADYDTVECFFENIEDFYQYLAKKKVVRNQDAVSEAKFRMLAGNKVNYIDEEGNVLPQFKHSNIYPTVDLPEKIFMNIEEHMQQIHNRMQLFLMDEKYSADYIRSKWIFSGCMELEEWNKLLEKNMDLALAEIDYYLYDYHMMANDRRPIDVYYEEAQNGKYGEFSKPSLELLQILTKTRPIVFTIEDYLEDGLYMIKEFFSNESFPLMLPIEEASSVEEFENILFYGHIFYNNTMTTQIIQGSPVTKKELVNLKKLFLRTKDWFTSQESNSGTMSEFFQRHAAMINHFLRFHDCIDSDTLEDLDWIKKYEFEKHVKFTTIREDEVTKYLDAHLPNGTFSARDLVLAKRLWTSFQETAKVELPRPELWAGAVLWNLGGINALFRIDNKVIVDMLEELQIEDGLVVSKYGNKIYDVLKLDNFDSRYLNEEGLIKKLFAEVLL